MRSFTSISPSAGMHCCDLTSPYAYSVRPCGCRRICTLLCSFLALQLRAPEEEGGPSALQVGVSSGHCHYALLGVESFRPACCHISVRCTIDLELLESNCQSLALRIAPAAEIRESSSQQLGRLSPSSVPLRDASQGKVCVIKTDVQGSKAM